MTPTPDPLATYLETLGRLLIQSGRNQSLARDWQKWLTGGTRPSADLDRLLTSLGVPAGDAGPRQTETAQAFRRWLKAFQVVPAAEHHRLVAEHEALQERCRRQQETIDGLQRLVAVGGRSQKDFVDGLQAVVENQGRRLHEAMTAFWPTASTDDESDRS